MRIAARRREGCMTTLWQMLAGGDDAHVRDDASADLADGEFTVDAPEVLPAHIEAFLALKATAAF